MKRVSPAPVVAPGSGFSLVRLRPQIWHINFVSGRDLNMHFFRFQEYFEGLDTRREKLQFVDLVERYTAGVGKGRFSYATDWAGFNLPSPDLWRRVREGIDDLNRYDSMMIALAEYMKAQDRTEHFYIIGTSDEDELKPVTFNHELAHGLYFAEPGYKAEMDSLTHELPEKVRDRFWRTLRNWGYNESSYMDETQAYMATGLYNAMDTKVFHEVRDPFVRAFNRSSRGLRKTVPKPEPEETAKKKTGRKKSK